MSYVKTSVPKPGDNKGVGADKRDLITIFDWADVADDRIIRDSKGVVIPSTINMKVGCYMIQVYGTVTTMKAEIASEGDPDGKAMNQTVSFKHPGSSVSIREFRFNWLNKNVGIIIQRGSSSSKSLFGDKYAPLQMELKASDDEKANTSEFTFKSLVKGPDEGDYQGTLTLEAPVATVAADAATVNLSTGEGEYQLTNGTAAQATLTGVTNPVNGMVFTLVGSGGSFPSKILSGADFLLASGTTWNALSGAKITFRVFKDGAATYKLIEVSRA
jgi:hypothetical protein